MRRTKRRAEAAISDLEVLKTIASYGWRGMSNPTGIEFDTAVSRLIARGLVREIRGRGRVATLAGIRAIDATRESPWITDRRQIAALTGETLA